MSVLRSRLVGEVYEYCGNPDDRPLAEKGLPQQFVFQVLSETEDEMLRDLELSNQGRRIDKQEVNLATDEFEFTLNDDAASPSYVTLQTDPSSTVWFPVEIVIPSALAQASAEGQFAVAFRGLSGEVSWQPDASHVLKVWYERSGNDEPRLAESTELGNLYDSYLKLRTAAQCREIMGLPIGDVMASRLSGSERQWQRFVTKGAQKGAGYKTRVFTPARLRRNYPFLDRTRFFVPR
jgi:hypothetical protein